MIYVYVCVYIVKYAFAIVMYFSNDFNNQFIIGPPAWPSVITNIIMYICAHTYKGYIQIFILYDLAM